jgi:hypothetical protein
MTYVPLLFGDFSIREKVIDDACRFFDVAAAMLGGPDTRNPLQRSEHALSKINEGRECPRAAAAGAICNSARPGSR